MKNEIAEAKANLMRWQRWAAGVAKRWQPDTPMALLARKKVLEAELRLVELRSVVSGELKRGGGAASSVKE